MKTYLKKETFGAITVIAFDNENLASVDVFRGENLDIRKFDDLSEFEYAINYQLSKGFAITTRNEFNKNYIKFSKNLNQIAKEL